MGPAEKLSIYHCTDLKPFNQMYIWSPNSSYWFTTSQSSNSWA